MPLEICLAEDVGCVVGYAPGIAHAPVRVSLRRVAEKLIRKGKLPPLSASELAALDRMGAAEVGAGKVRKKLKAAVKKVAKPVVKAAKAVAKSKVVRAVAKVAAKIVPPPASFAITGAQAAAKLGKAIKKGNPKAKKIAPLVKAAAKGEVTPAKLQQEARAAGVDPNLALEAAAVAKVADMAANGDVQAQAAMNVAAQLTSPNVSEQQKAQETIGKLAVVKAAESGDASAFLVTTPDGRQFRTMVVPNTATQPEA